MQGVAELVEHGVHFVVGHQGRLAIRRLRDVEMIAPLPGLWQRESGWRHRALFQAPPRVVGPRVEVAEESPNGLPVFIEDLKKT